MCSTPNNPFKRNFVTLIKLWFLLTLQVAHESWRNAKMHYSNMKKTYLKSWEQSRRELLDRVMATFAEAGMEYEARKLAKEEREKQRELCRGLCDKVSLKEKAACLCCMS